MTDSDLHEIGIQRKRRSDLNSEHKKPKFGTILLRQYLLNGKFAGEYRSIQEAVSELRAGGADVSYQGIRRCILGQQRQCGGFLWRSDVGKGRGLLVMDKEKEDDELYKNSLYEYLLSKCSDDAEREEARRYYKEHYGEHTDR